MWKKVLTEDDDSPEKRLEYFYKLTGGTQSTYTITETAEAYSLTNTVTTTLTFVDEEEAWEMLTDVDSYAATSSGGYEIYFDLGPTLVAYGFPAEEFYTQQQQ